MKGRTRVLAVLAVALAAVFLSPVAMAQARRVSFSEHRQRRQRLMDEIGSAVAVFLGARSRPDMEIFQQSNDFFYLTGCEIPDAFLLVDGVRKESVLFIPPSNSMGELWNGPMAKPGPKLARSYRVFACLGYTAARPRSRETPDLLGDEIKRRAKDAKRVLAEGSPAEIGTRISDTIGPFAWSRKKDPWDGRETRQGRFTAKLATLLGRRVADATPVVRRMRRVKSPAEVAILKEAARISARALRRVIAGTRPGLHEYQLASMLEASYKWFGGQGYAYSPIVGSGLNATVIHYLDNRAQLKSGDVVMIDSAARYNYYTSDISRAFPASGKWTPRQREIYNIVLEAQRAGIKACRPGATMAAVHRVCSRIISRAGYGRFFPHGACHTVGLAVHDGGGYAMKLEPGMLITVEPGIYLPDEKLGIRIEDVVLITKTGAQVITGDVPKDPDEIERLMASGRNSETKRTSPPEKTGDSGSAETRVAVRWVKELFAGNVDAAMELSSTPFIFDRRETIETRAELRAMFEEVREKKGARPKPRTRVIDVPEEKLPRLRKRARAPEGSMMVVVSILEREAHGDSIVVFVRPGPKPVVVGFSD